MSLSLGIGLSIVLQPPVLAGYLAAGFDPAIVYDFASTEGIYGAGYFRKAGTEVAFADLFNHSRASIATYTDADGILQTASSGTPRRENYTYNGSSWVGPKCLIEPDAATNLVDNSTDLTVWSALSTSSVITDATGPDGETSATTITAASGNGSPRINRSCTATATNVHTATFRIKKGNYDFISCSVLNGSAAWFVATVDLSLGAITKTGSGASGTYITSNIKDIGNGFYLVSVTGSLASGATMTPVMAMTDGATPNYGSFALDNFTANGTETLIAYGPQLETGYVPSSYIPTSGSTVTRAAETLVIPAANLASIVNTDAMSISTKGTMDYADTNQTPNTSGGGGEGIMMHWRLGSSDYINQQLDTGTDKEGTVYFTQERTGDSVPDTVTSEVYTPGLDVPFNIASRHTSGAINGAIDGAA